MSRWTPSADAELRRLAALGKNSAEIGAQMGRSQHGVWKRASAIGIRFRDFEKPEKEWIVEARRLIAGGSSLKQAARTLGRAETTLRVALNINGAREKMLESNRRAKARERARLREESPAEQHVSRRSAMASRAVRNAERSVASSYVKRPDTKAAISLPSISLPEVHEPPRVFRIVPRVRAQERPGAARWRSIHQGMLRSGKLPSRDVISEWRS